MNVKAAIIILIFFSSAALTHAQHSRTIGLSGTVQAGQYGIGLPIWLDQQFVLAPTFDFKYAEKAGTDFSIGLAPRFYFRNDKIAPYLGFKGGILVNIPYEENEVDREKKIDYLLGIAFGGEYFLDEKFSLGVEAQGNFTKSDEDSYRFGNPKGINFNTATMIIATFYF